MPSLCSRDPFGLCSGGNDGMDVICFYIQRMVDGNFLVAQLLNSVGHGALLFAIKYYWRLRHYLFPVHVLVRGTFGSKLM